MKKKGKNRVGTKLPKPELFTGNWNHLFGPGRAETRCRIVVDVASDKLVAAQAFDGLKWIDLQSAERADLAESLFEANDVSKAPKDWGLLAISTLPEWATPQEMQGQSQVDVLQAATGAQPPQDSHDDEIRKSAESAARLAIAQAFCTEVVSTLTEEELTLVRERNRAETSAGVCHTHDFCDANMLMYAAFVKCGLAKDVADVISDELQLLWNAAWELAIKAEFHADRIGADDPPVPPL